MQATTFGLETADGMALFVYRWLPAKPLKGIVQIAHGWAEHAGRYARVAEALCGEGYGVYAHDHRGHGRTARTADDLGLFAESNGWDKCLDDLWLLHQRIAAEFPGIPIVAFGHSLGSFMTQQFITEHGESVAGAVLSGSNGRPPAIATIGRWLARLERARRGPRAASQLMQWLIFSRFNKAFRPTRTSADWLSRDRAEVDKYLADPLCGGFVSTTQLYVDILDALRDVASPARQARIPKNLPIYIFGGGRDPVGADIDELLAAYHVAGLTAVTHKFYPDGRHESLNELNRDEVTRDLIAWLNPVVARAVVGRALDGAAPIV